MSAPQSPPRASGDSEANITTIGNTPLLEFVRSLETRLAKLEAASSRSTASEAPVETHHPAPPPPTPARQTGPLSSTSPAKPKTLQSAKQRNTEILALARVSLVPHRPAPPPPTKGRKGVPKSVDTILDSMNQIAVEDNEEIEGEHPSWICQSFTF